MKRGKSIGLGLLVAIVALPTAWAATFQRAGEYVYTKDGQTLGREVFATADVLGGHEITSQTDLDLGLFLLRQTSRMRVGSDGSFQALAVDINSGGRRYGFEASRTGNRVSVRDTITQQMETRELDPRGQWLVGNFMQHLIYAFSRYDRQARATQSLPIEAGEIVFSFVGPSWLQKDGERRPAEHYRAQITEANSLFDLYVGPEGSVDAIGFAQQAVIIYRHGFESWEVGP